MSEQLPRERIPPEDEQIIAHISGLLGEMYTLDEIADNPDLTREEWIARIEQERDELEQSLERLKAYKRELDSRSDLAERLRHDVYLRNAYEDMTHVIEQWEEVLY